MAIDHFKSHVPNRLNKKWHDHMFDLKLKIKSYASVMTKSS